MQSATPEQEPDATTAASGCWRPSAERPRTICRRRPTRASETLASHCVAEASAGAIRADELSQRERRRRSERPDVSSRDQAHVRDRPVLATRSSSCKQHALRSGSVGDRARRSRNGRAPAVRRGPDVLSLRRGAGAAESQFSPAPTCAWERIRSSRRSGRRSRRRARVRSIAELAEPSVTPRQASPSGRKQQRGARSADDCFDHGPSRAALQRAFAGGRTRPSQRAPAGCGRRSCFASECSIVAVAATGSRCVDSRTAGAMQQPTARWGTAGVRPKREPRPSRPHS
jgi:hypothetical protein